MSFKEFLEKNRSNYPSETIEWVSVQALGNYYWHKFEDALVDLGAWIQVYNSKKRHSKQWKIEHSLNKQWQYKKLDCLKRQCVVLLGKKEVDKRLKELEK